MKNVVWKEGYFIDGFLTYFTTIGSIEVYCIPEVVYPYGFYNRKRVSGWKPSFWSGKVYIEGARVRKSLEDAESDAEKLVIDFLLSYGASVLTQLKRAGILEEAMSIAGID